jgi:predicted esterase
MKLLTCLLNLILSVFLVINFAWAQERYRSEITDSVRIETCTYAVKDGNPLDMDIYLPVSDNEIHRPLIFYVHGGGFSGGTRDSEEIKTFCKRLSQYGYVVSSISYRLTRQGAPGELGCDCPSGEKMATFKKAVEDLQDATLFMINYREKFGIDPYKIILSGSSAGAETVLNTAYQPPYCYGLDNGPVSYAGVIAMAGAIPDTSKISKDYPAVPSLLFHGTCDNLVPYGTAPHRHCKENQPGYLILHGSYTIAEQLRKIQAPFWLITYCNAAHEIAGKPMTANFNEIIEFCYSFVLNKSTEQRTTVIKTENKTCKYQSFNFCEK